MGVLDRARSAFPNASKNKDEAMAAPIILSWQIGLFLLTSTIVQNFSYLAPTYLFYSNPYGWSMDTYKYNKYNSLVNYVLYWGPVFGLVIDLVRVLKERYRPVIIIASVLNAIIFFVIFGMGERIQRHYYACLMLCWLMQVLVMFIYIPMNAVVIRYGNSHYYNYFRYHFQHFYGAKPGDRNYVSEEEYKETLESSARVGSLMAQAMVWRTFGSFLYQIIYQFCVGDNSMKPHVSNRYFMLFAAVGSCILVVQVLLTKRKYYLDYRKSNLRTSTCVQFYKNMVNMRKDTMSRNARAWGTNFMFVLCFIFIYFLVPDALYNTMYSFNYAFSATFSRRWNQANSIVSSLGAVLGAAAYAIWMYLAHLKENRRTKKKLELFKYRQERATQRDTGAVTHGNNGGDERNGGAIIVGDNDDDEPQHDDEAPVDPEEQKLLEDPDMQYKPWVANPFVIVLAGCSAWAFGTFFHFFGQMGSNSPSFNFRVFFIFQSLIVQACLRFAFMPALTLTALHAPFEYEAAAFEIFSVCTSGGGLVSSSLTDSVMTSLGATVTAGYWKFLLLAIFFQFLPLLVAVSLPKNREDVRRDADDDERQQNEPFQRKTASQE